MISDVRLVFVLRSRVNLTEIDTGPWRGPGWTFQGGTVLGGVVPRLGR